MYTANIQQSFEEKQCLHAAYDLIQAVIDIKSSYCEEGGFSSVAQAPQFTRLLMQLEQWTDALMIKQGGL